LIKGDGHLPDIHLKYGPASEGYGDLEGQNEGQYEGQSEGQRNRRGTDLEGYGDSRGYDSGDERGYSGRGQHDLDPRDVKVYIEGQGDLDDDEYDEDGRDRRRGGRGKGHSSRLDGAKSWSKTQSGYNTSGGKYSLYFVY
jgi:hypothetical protein